MNIIDIWTKHINFNKYLSVTPIRNCKYNFIVIGNTYWVRCECVPNERIQVVNMPNETNPDRNYIVYKDVILNIKKPLYLLKDDSTPISSLLDKIRITHEH